MWVSLQRKQQEPHCSQCLLTHHLTFTSLNYHSDENYWRLTVLQTIKSCAEVGRLRTPQLWLWTLSPPKYHSLLVAPLIFSKHRMEGAELLLKALWGTHRSPKPPQLIPRRLHPRPGCVGQHWTDADEQLRSGNQATQPRGLCLNTTASLASDPGQGKQQAPRAQEDASCDLGCPQSRFQGLVCLLGHSPCVCAVPWQPACTAPSALGNKAASTSQPPTISKELSSLLLSKSKQNTATDTMGKTKPYLNWDLRTHTKLPAGVSTRQPQAGLLEAPPQLMVTSQEKQRSCGNNLTLVKFQKI